MKSKLYSYLKIMHSGLLPGMFLFAVLCSNYGYSQTWSSVGNGGADDWVYATAVYNGDLIAAGKFTSIGGVYANHIARWDGVSWHPLSLGVNAKVWALIVHNGLLYVGGEFTMAGGIPMNFIAIWDGAQWSNDLGDMGSIVSSFAIYNNRLIVGGYFTDADGVPLNYVAQYGPNGWEGLGNGVVGTQGQIMAMEVYNNELIVGGFFTYAGGIRANHVARWNGSTWSALGSGISNIVYSFTNYNGKLIAGGLFLSAGGVPANHIASWDGASWSAMGSGMSGPFYQYVFALKTYNGNLIAGGYFTQSGGVQTNGIAKWDGSTWSALGCGLFYPANVCGTHTLCLYNQDLILGGLFVSAGCMGAAHIAAYSESASILSLSTTGTGTGCIENYTGSVDLSVNGNAPPYTYHWSNGATTQDISGLAVGTYNVTVTDALSAVRSTSYMVDATGGQISYFYDLDGDGYGAGWEYIDCVQPPNTSLNNLDCDNGNSAVYPGAPELCNGIDDNCNGQVDEGVLFTTYFMDADNDGFGNPNISITTCNGIPPSYNYILDNTDCDDTNGFIYPGAPELCNGIDDNCNGQIDEGIVFTTYYSDADWDGYGDPVDSIITCTGNPQGYVSDNTDCDVKNGSVYPGAPELCNGIDDNCNGLIDEGCMQITGIVTNTVCAGTSDGVINISINGGSGPYTYLWSNERITEDISGLAEGNYTVTVTDNTSLMASASFFVSTSVPSAVPATPGSISGAGAVCVDLSTYTYSIANVTDATKYLWTVPTYCTLLSGQGSTTINVRFSSLYVSGAVTVKAGNCVGSSGIRSLTVAKQILPGAPVAINGAKSICIGNSYVYSVVAVAGATYYRWTVPAHTTIISGQGTTVLTVGFLSGFSRANIGVAASNCAGTSSARTLTVSLLAAPSRPGTISGASSVCPGVYTYSVTAVTGATAYIWTVPANASVTSGQGTNIVSVTFVSGFVSGNVSVAASNCTGASAAKTKTVAISRTCGAAKGDEIVDSSPVNERSSYPEFAVRVFPNPFANEFHLLVQNPFAAKLEIRIFDLLGKLIAEKIESEYSAEINMGDNLLKGIYLVEVKQGEQLKVLRIVKSDW